jgi:hypothetical protein
MENPFFVVSAKFTAYNQKYFVEVIVKFSDEENGKTIAYLEHPKRKEDVKVFENLPGIIKKYILKQGKWRKCTTRELRLLNSQN